TASSQRATALDCDRSERTESLHLLQSNRKPPGTFAVWSIVAKFPHCRVGAHYFKLESHAGHVVPRWFDSDREWPPASLVGPRTIAARAHCCEMLHRRAKALNSIFPRKLGNFAVTED